jgi:chemotaxis protein CheD
VRNIGGSLRGEHGRRIQFWPVSGRARQVLLGQETQALLASERVVAKPPAATGGLELF